MDLINCFRVILPSIVLCKPSATFGVEWVAAEETLVFLVNGCHSDL